MSKIETAVFVKLPFTINGLKRIYSLKDCKPYIIEQEIILGEIDYENLITDLCVDRDYIESNRSLMKIDETGTWHCILVRQRNKYDGILIMSDGQVYPKWAAYRYYK